MKIPNYDRKKQENQKNNFFDEDFRLLIAGESGCGKTNTVNDRISAAALISNLYLGVRR